MYGPIGGRGLDRIFRRIGALFHYAADRLQDDQHIRHTPVDIPGSGHRRTDASQWEERLHAAASSPWADQSVFSAYQIPPAFFAQQRVVDNIPTSPAQRGSPATGTAPLSDPRYRRGAKMHRPSS